MNKGKLKIKDLVVGQVIWKGQYILLEIPSSPNEILMYHRESKMRVIATLQEIEKHSNDDELWPSNNEINKFYLNILSRFSYQLKMSEIEEEKYKPYAYNYGISEMDFVNNGQSEYNGGITKGIQKCYLEIMELYKEDYGNQNEKK